MVRHTVTHRKSPEILTFKHTVMVLILWKAFRKSLVSVCIHRIHQVLQSDDVIVSHYESQLRSVIHKLQDEHHEDMLTSSFPVWSWPEVNPMGFSKRRISADYPWRKSFEMSVMVFHENCHKSARARKNRLKRLLEIKQNVTKMEKRKIFVPTN